MRQVNDLFYDDWGSPKKGTYPLPCQGIENLTYDYSEKTGPAASDAQSKFMVQVHFPNLKYREITHVQEYDIESLVGNIGGYLGLFLGYTLLHFPAFMISVFVLIKKKLMPWFKCVIKDKSFPPNNTLSGSTSTAQQRTTNDEAVQTDIQCECRALSNASAIVQLAAIETRLDEVERQMSLIQVRRRQRESCSHHSARSNYIFPVGGLNTHPLHRVQVTEWQNNNAVATPNYI